MRHLTVLFFALFLIACNGVKKDVVEYETGVNGIKYHYYEKSDTGQQVKKDDYLLLDLTYTLERTDSLLFDSKEMPGKYRLKAKDPVKGYKKEPMIEYALRMMRVGDSMSFRLPAKIFYHGTRNVRHPTFIINSDTLLFNVRLKEINTAEQVRADYLKLKEKNKKEELVILEDYVQTHYPDAEPSATGLYRIILEEGSGKEVRPGDFVSIHYEGTLINGEKFDSTYDRDKVFSFDLGKAEVIAGLQEGVTGLNVGTKAVLIIPSHLAYKDHGYGRRIGPYATLIFTIKVMDIQNFN